MADEIDSGPKPPHALHNEESGAGPKPPPALNKENGMETASVLEDDKLTQDLYEEIKARTMFNMIEEIDAGKQNLLFLTNKQEELLASPENVGKLFNALEVDGHVYGKPKLLIVLQWDGRFRTQLQAAGPGNFYSYNVHERTNGPFVNTATTRALLSRAWTSSCSTCSSRSLCGPTPLSFATR